jgi:hypothetical protein
MKQLTKELLDRYSSLPDNAYLDSHELQKLLDVKCLGLHIRYGYLPAPSERHKACSQAYKARVTAKPLGWGFYSPRNTKVYWRVGVLRAFVALTEETAVEVLKQLSSSIAATTAAAKSKG